MLAEKTGWSYKTLLWEVSWLNIKMMLADAPSMKRVPKTKKKRLKMIKGSEKAELLKVK